MRKPLEAVKELVSVSDLLDARGIGRDQLVIVVANLLPTLQVSVVDGRLMAERSVIADFAGLASAVSAQARGSGRYALTKSAVGA